MLTADFTDLVRRDPEAAKNKNIWCYRPGEACYKAKRDAVAIAREHDDAEGKQCAFPLRAMNMLIVPSYRTRQAQP